MDACEGASQVKCLRLGMTASPSAVTSGRLQSYLVSPLLSAVRSSTKCELLNTWKSVESEHSGP
jgi:hypothetical protein